MWFDILTLPLPLPTSNLLDPHLQSFPSPQYSLANSETTRNYTKYSSSNAVRYVRLDHNGTQVSCTDSPLLFGVVASHRAVIKPSWSRSLGPAFAHETPVICCKPTTICFTLNHGWNLFLHHVKQAGLPAFYNVCFCYVSSCLYVAAGQSILGIGQVRLAGQLFSLLSNITFAKFCSIWQK